MQIGFSEYDCDSNDSINEITNYMYLGSCNSCMNVLDNRNDIKYILNLSQYKLYAPYKNVMEIDIEDNYDAPIENHFIETHNFINEARVNNSKVLVHCKAGISRSATIVISYLMRYENISYIDAFFFVKDKRRCVMPNGGFVGKLEEYEKKLKIEK